MLMRPLVRSRTLLAHSSPPLPHGNVGPSTSDMRYSLLYAVCAMAAAAATAEVREVRSFIGCLLVGWGMGEEKSVAQPLGQPERNLRKHDDQQHRQRHGQHQPDDPAGGLLHAYTGNLAGH